MMTAEASSSSSFSHEWPYDVFLSFRGKDTRTGFTGNLYNTLLQRGINTFIDNQELQRGDQITPSLLQAIEDSRIAIIVLSKNYAFSSFCLCELAKILECIKGKGRLVFPVFYDVDPSEVRHQRGSFGEALALHEEKFRDNKEMVHEWRMVLHQVANLSGWHFKHRDEYEYEFIERIVKEVSNKIYRASLHVANYPVGLESRVLEVKSLLDVGSDGGVHMVGIYGIGGIGKTTIARAVYNLIAEAFDASCFLDDVRENSIKYGLVHLQEMFLHEIFGDKDVKLGHENQGITIIKRKLYQKKILLILDDVDKLEQLQAILGGFDRFAPGSIVIITTRDKNLLASYGVERTYKVKKLNKKEALELLCWNAFKNHKVDSSYVNSLNRTISYACGLPLALEVIGSNLFGKGPKEWESALDQYERIPNKVIQKILKVSFDALEENEQKIFLDIACCFKGYKLVDVKDILCAHHGVCLDYGIEVLIGKLLIKVIDGLVTLHDLIQDMCREIVRQESPEDPSKRSRLWSFNDIVQVLEENMGSSKIQIIVLDFPVYEQEQWKGPKYEVDWDGKAFKKMKNLKTLIIRGVHFSKGPRHLPNSLRVLNWWGYPSPSLPFDFHPKKLVIIKLPNSCIMPFEPLKRFVNLKVLDVSYCKCLTLPDVSGAPNLEELSFRYCKNLIRIHNSVGFLEKLRILDALSCTKLETFPPIKLTSLEKLELSFCSSLKSFPEIIGKMENIIELCLRWIPIKELPFSIRNLTRLRSLHLEGAGMVHLPRSLAMLSELSQMKIWLCKGLRSSKQVGCAEKMSPIVCSNMECLALSECNISDEVLPIALSWFANVKFLNLSCNNFTILPTCIKECRYLRNLCLNDCKLLREIRGIPPNLERLSARNCISLTSWSTSMLLNQEFHEAGNRMFSLPGSRIPLWFDQGSCGGSISFWFRNKFPAIALCLVAGWVYKCCPTANFRLKLIINGNKQYFASQDIYEFPLETDHIFLFDLQQTKFEDNWDKILLENEWNHVEVSYIAQSSTHGIMGSIAPEYCTGLIEGVAKQSGVHVLKQKCRMDDIRFTNPYYVERRNLDDELITSESNYHMSLKEKHGLVGIGVSETQSLQQQQQQLALKTWLLEQGKDWLPLLRPPAWISGTTSVKGCEIASRKRKRGLLKLEYEASEPFCQAPSKVSVNSYSIIPSLASDIASDGGLQDQHSTSKNEQNFEGCESVNEDKGKGMVACNSSDTEDIQLLSMTKEYLLRRDENQDGSKEKSMTWDPMELEFRLM